MWLCGPVWLLGLHRHIQCIIPIKDLKWYHFKYHYSRHCSPFTESIKNNAQSKRSRRIFINITCSTNWHRPAFPLPSFHFSSYLSHHPDPLNIFISSLTANYWQQRGMCSKYATRTARMPRAARMHHVQHVCTTCSTYAQRAASMHHVQHVMYHAQHIFTIDLTSGATSNKTFIKFV